MVTRGESVFSQRYSLFLADSPTEVIELEGGGKRFYKQIVKFGNWVSKYDPDAKMKLDKAWGEKIVANFKKKVIPRVPVPLSHTDLPEFNTGEVLGIDVKDDGLYATLDIRDSDAAAKIENDLIWDVSISFANEYIDPKSGEEVGPTLFHVALVNDPYLKGMKPFEALARKQNAIMLSENGDITMATAKVINDREFPVTVSYQDGDETKEVTIESGQEVEVPEEASEAVTEQVAKAEKPAEETTTETETETATESETPQTTEPEKSEREQELEKELSETKAKLRQRDAEDAFTKLLSEGKVVPAQKDTFISLHLSADSTIKLSDGSTKSSTDLLTELLEAGPKRVDFSEKGNSGDEVEKTPWEKLSDEERAGNIALGVTAEEFNKVNSDQSNNTSSEDDEDEE